MVPSFRYMVVSEHKGTPIQTPKDYSPYYWDPQNGTPNFIYPIPYGPYGLDVHRQ